MDTSNDAEELRAERAARHADRKAWIRGGGGKRMADKALSFRGKERDARIAGKDSDAEKFATLAREYEIETIN